MTKATSYTHPLDPLAVEEVEACSRACASHAADAGLGKLRFNVISLKVQTQVRTQDPSLQVIRQAGATASAKKLP